jgi:hypothetical protein
MPVFNKKAKARTVKQGLSERQREQRKVASKARARSFTRDYQAAAGKKLVEKRGRTHMSRIGKRGYQVTKARYPNFASMGGIAAWKLNNRCMLDEGYFPNQSPAQWNYCQVEGCHHDRLNGSCYCSHHQGSGPVES